MVRTILIGMTGSGNSALKVLSNHPLIELIGVITPKKQDTPFPYYECEQLQNEVKSCGIALYDGLVLKDDKTYQLIKTLSPDLIVVGSFKQIVPQIIISIPKIGVINVHPSLLPKYRGATPTVWALLNGEKETGVTIHFIEDEKIDSGRIIAQASLKIDSSDNDGTLRLKLAKLSEKVLHDAIYHVFSKDRLLFKKQDESKATWYPKLPYKVRMSMLSKKGIL